MNEHSGGSGYFYNPDGAAEIDLGGNGGGYQELFIDGTHVCLGWNDTLDEIVGQMCTGATWQLWAGTGTTPDLIWNKWYDTNHHTFCPYGVNGYTQAVISAASVGATLGLECPLDSGGNVYDISQKWYLEMGGFAPVPSPSPSDPPAPPPPPPSTTAPDGVPSSDYQPGGITASLTGAQLLAQWDQTQTFNDACPTLTNCNPGSFALDGNGSVVLTTTGGKGNVAMLSSYKLEGGGGGPVGTTYTNGVFEAELYLPAAGSKVANWPAFWLSGLSCPPGVADPALASTLGCWPVGGEFDITEGLGGLMQSHYFWNVGGGNVSGVHGPSVAVTPGWHIFDGVWKPGSVSVYMDGALVWTYTSANVESDTPLEVNVDMAGSGGGVSSLGVAYFRSWELP
jgi:hypothetical protein